MKMSKWFHEKVTLCGDTIEDSEFAHAVMLCEYLVDGVDAGVAICHAINNHDRMMEEIEELKEFVCSLQLDVSNEIKLENLLAKLNQEGRE